MQTFAHFYKTHLAKNCWNMASWTWIWTLQRSSKEKLRQTGDLWDRDSWWDLRNHIYWPLHADHLREALRHDTKELNLYTHASLFRHSNLKEYVVAQPFLLIGFRIQNIVTGKIKTCKISLGIYSFRMSLPFMESLVKLLQSNLSRLEIHVPSPKLHDWASSIY